MSVSYAVRHETRYDYGGEVVLSHQQLHLTPRDTDRQRCVQHQLLIGPTPATRSEYLDAFGNRVTRLELDRPHDRLDVVADMQVSLDAAPELDLSKAMSWERVRDQLVYDASPRDEEWLDASRYRNESPYVRIKRQFGDFARDCLAPGVSVVTVADALMAKIHREFTYAPGETEIATPLLEVFKARRGVCQDFAHLMIACLRSVGLAARYVSGYLRTHPPTVEAESEGEARVGADASHAWVAVFAPPFGWVEFDPTNKLRVDQEHVTLAWGRDFGDVSPLRGVILGAGSHTLSVRVTVLPLPAAAAED